MANPVNKATSNDISASLYGAVIKTAIKNKPDTPQAAKPTQNRVGIDPNAKPRDIAIG